MSRAPATSSASSCPFTTGGTAPAGPVWGVSRPDGVVPGPPPSVGSGRGGAPWRSSRGTA
eukprot:14605539-Alexandrium_andersonii.AAC.1